MARASTDGRARVGRLPSGPPGPPPVLGLLNEATARFGQQMVDQMTERGIDHSLAKSRLMGFVPAEGIRLTDLADKLNVTKQSCGQMVDDLVQTRELERRPDPTDGRAKLIHFGPEGDRSLPLAWAALHEVEATMATRIGTDGVEQLRRLLARALEERPVESDASGPGG